MRPPVALPETGSFRLAHVRLHETALGETVAKDLAFDADGFARADIIVDAGRIAAVAPHAGVEAGAIDGHGGIVLPAFVDCHTHLDKGQIWGRAPNPDGSFMGALDAAGRDRVDRWTRDDIARRMDFALRSAYAHGTAAIRTHLDCVAPGDLAAWDLFTETRNAWKGRIDLQAACLMPIDIAGDRARLKEVADTVAAAGGVLGAFTYMLPDLDALLDAMFAAAIDRGLDLDFHADETADVAAIALSRIAAAALRSGFEGRILVGHCCSLARQPEKTVLETLDAVARAGISVVSLPMCNMYLQDRRADATTPRWRGVTLVHEMAARGINVSVASDNTRDPFYAYGDLDPLEVYRAATRILHLDHPVGRWPAAIGANPARAMGLSGAGRVAPGDPADFVLFRGRSFTELLSRPESDRVVVRDGRPIVRDLPDYSDLDDLMET